MLLGGVLLLLAYVVAEDNLIAVSVLYRHGDRVIAQSYPTDPYQNESFWPVPYGELTNRGKQQHYNLGKWLRDRYNNFLSTKYMAKEFRIQSSNYDRCLMSASANLAGLYPPQNDQIWMTDLPWQPIPIHTTPNELDGMLALEKPCPGYEVTKKKMLQTEHYQKMFDTNRELFDYLTEQTGDKVNTITYVNDLYDTLLIESWYNFTLPKWTEKVFPNKLLPLAEASFEMETHTPEIARFRAGQLLDKVLNQFDSYLTIDSDYEKFRVYSAHDTNVYNILNSLRIPNLKLVPYAGMIMFELRRTTDGRMYVQLWYKREEELLLLTIPGCESDCNYDKFREIVKPLAVNEEQWDEACSLKQSKRRKRRNLF